MNINFKALPSDAKSDIIAQKLNECLAETAIEILNENEQIRSVYCNDAGIFKVYVEEKEEVDVINVD
jgi:hypothetical protein